MRAAILDPATLSRVIPGAERVTRAADGAFVATLGLGVGRFRGRQTIRLRLQERGADRLLVCGDATGPFGTGKAEGEVELLPGERGGTVIAWRYDGTVRGPVTLAGPLLLRLTAASFTAAVFRTLGWSLTARRPPPA